VTPTEISNIAQARALKIVRLVVPACRWATVNPRSGLALAEFEREADARQYAETIAAECPVDVVFDADCDWTVIFSIPVAS
jgi:hypothetical protein